MKKINRLQIALERGLASGGNLSDEIKGLDGYEIASLADAEVLCIGLSEFCKRSVTEHRTSSAFSDLIHLFQSVTSAEAFRYLALKGIPLLIEAYDERIANSQAHESELLFALKIFARYGIEEGLDRVVDAAHSDALDDNYLWSVIFEQLGDSDPLIPGLISRLSKPLPNRFACVSFLNWVNRLARDHVISSHPFNSSGGTEFLRDWLSDSQTDQFSFAHSAAAALPFISDPPRSELLALAADHPDIGVQMESAWASARLGSDASAKFLSRMCLDRDHTMAARAYLTELNRKDLIPDNANDPDFMALAEMCDWLKHPQEFGRPPDEIELSDSRELFWPPTNDWRTLWIFKYRYRPESESDVEATGVGVTGSITFSLSGETRVDMSPEDIYALHCCWELETNEDPRSPAARSIEAGRALIKEAQEDDIDDDEKF